MALLHSLYASHYFSTLHFALIVLHVTAALLSLLVAPVAMVVSKGVQVHRRWGLIYFWSMVVVNSLALWLLIWRFNLFLFGITVLTIYNVVTGYRVLQRKRRRASDQPNWLDWGLTGSALVVGIGLLLWGIATLLNLTVTFIPSGGSMGVLLGLLPLLFGGAILQSVLTDLRLFRTAPVDHNWWWYYHMERMVASYIGLLTALMVQQVGPRMPDAYAWLAWVAPTLIGSPLLSRWIVYYRNQFEGKRRAAVLTQTEPLSS